MKREVLIALVIILLVPTSYALNLGTVKGYVLNSLGGIEPTSNVTITVTGCTGTGCNDTDITDTNGFYIESNLNIIPGNTVQVSATKGLQYGSASGIATGSGDVGVATINVTMCTAPQTPILSAVSDSHSNSVASMSWTTFKAGLEYDEFQFNSGTSNITAVSPQVKSNVAYQVHTWKVRTCTTGGACCSNYATDTFDIYNNLPSSPTLIDQANTNINSLTFNWSHPGTDPDGDGVTFDFQLDGITTSNVTKPHSASGISSGSHTWGIRACDGISCTSFSQDSFSITNAAAASPTLTDQGHTSSTTLSLSWTNTSDPDSDPTHNEFQLSTDSGFSTIVSNDSNAVSPKVISSLTTFTLYYWRVRTCDNQNACSSYNSDLFFVYESTGNGTNTTITEFVSGGRKTITINNTEICLPRWECRDWGICSSKGITSRSCFDANGCAPSPPVSTQSCLAEGSEPQVEKPEALPDVLDLTDLTGSIEIELKIGEEKEFLYNGEEHILKLISTGNNLALIEIRSDPKRYTILSNETSYVDVNGDDKDDFSVDLIYTKEDSAKFLIRLNGHRTETPLSTAVIMNQLKKLISKIGTTPLILSIIILALISALAYEYKHYIIREIKIDKKLTSYIQSGRTKGFDDAAIRTRLIANGFPEEEIDYVFSRIK